MFYSSAIEDSKEKRVIISPGTHSEVIMPTLNFYKIL